MTPAPEWYAADADDADRYPTTPHTGHPGADLSDADGRNPLEPTNAYIKRLTIELKATRDDLTEARNDAIEAWREVDRLTAIVKPCFCGGEHHAAIDKRPCAGKNANVCVAEGCFGQACIKP